MAGHTKFKVMLQVQVFELWLWTWTGPDRHRPEIDKIVQLITCFDEHWTTPPFPSTSCPWSRQSGQSPPQLQEPPSWNGPWRSQPYASSSAYENQIWCEKILVHVHLLVQNPVVEGGHHEVAAAGRDAQPVNHEGVIILTVTSLLVLVSFSSFNGIRSEMDQQYQAFNLWINKITKQKSNHTIHIHFALSPASKSIPMTWSRSWAPSWCFWLLMSITLAWVRVRWITLCN